MRKDPDDFVQAIIDRAGHAVLGVGADGADTPSFSYTVGVRERYDLPDVIVFGLPFEIARAVLNEIVLRLRAGDIFKPRQRYAKIFERFDAAFVDVAAEVFEEFALAVATRRQRRAEAAKPALQLIWPDKDGVFPWERPVPPHVASQPLLG